jgi:hypothetical protein
MRLRHLPPRMDRSLISCRHSSKASRKCQRKDDSNAAQAKNRFVGVPSSSVKESREYSLPWRVKNEHPGFLTARAYHIAVPVWVACMGGRSEATLLIRQCACQTEPLEFKGANLHSVGLIKQLVRNSLSRKLLDVSNWPACSLNWIIDLAPRGNTARLLDLICGNRKEQTTPHR